LSFDIYQSVCDLEAKNAQNGLLIVRDRVERSLAFKLYVFTIFWVMFHFRILLVQARDVIFSERRFSYDPFFPLVGHQKNQFKGTVA